ncbi:MAG: hypothetical protein R8M11_09410 [Gallionella sp.]
MFRYLCIIWLCMPPIAFADSDRVYQSDLFVKEAFFHAEQGEYIDAISRMDIALRKAGGLGNPKLKTLYFRIGDKQLSTGDFELSYRMFNRVESGYDGVISKNLFQTVRNQAASQLARVYFHGGEPEKALAHISKIVESDSKFPEEQLFLRAQIYMSTGNYSKAVNLLRKLDGSENYQNFAEYNLAIAQLRSGHESEGFELLVKLGEVSTENEIDLALIDKANLVLGSLMLEKKKPVLAKQHFNRVRLSGPYTNKALLGSGWADVAQNRYDRALVPWTELSKRDVSDRYVQEGLLGVPFAYAKLKLPGRAILQFSKSIELFDSEMSRLDASIQSVKDGKFLLSLFRIGSRSSGDWASKLRNVEKTPETQYLWELLVSNDIQLSLNNYMDLDALVRKIEVWERYLDGLFAKSGQPARGSLVKAGENVQSLRSRMEKSKKKADGLLSKQGQLLEKMVIDDLKQRRKKITEHRVQASIGMIESYAQADNQNVLPRGIE